MNRSELVTAQHLARKAIIYIRQSSPHQVLTNQGSLRRPYALEQRARNLGWRPEQIATIDADVGLSATAAQHREGFKEMVTQVTLGQVRIIRSSKVTRLSGNSSDWYPRLDLVSAAGCLRLQRRLDYRPRWPLPSGHGQWTFMAWSERATSTTNYRRPLVDLPGGDL